MAIVEGCLGKSVQILLFLTNFLVFVLGCVVLGFGAYVLVTGFDIVELIDSTGEGSIKIYSSAAILLIVIACAVVLVTFFGCCGAWNVNRCMLGTYFTAILVLFICILVGAVIAVTQDLSFVKGALEKTMPKYGNEAPDEKVLTEAWDGIQTDYDCCGVTFFSDWKDFGSGAIFKDKDGKQQDYTVPISCCEGLDGTELDLCVFGTKQNNATKGYHEGCWTKFERDIIDANQDEILYTGIAIIIIMFLNMLCAFAMCTMAGGDR